MTDVLIFEVLKIFLVNLAFIFGILGCRAKPPAREFRRVDPQAPPDILLVGSGTHDDDTLRQVASIRDERSDKKPKRARERFSALMPLNVAPSRSNEPVIG
ncbi:unnamed protein product, partial [Mesorhabditis spiculigera]